jgi:hypothetical protein
MDENIEENQIDDTSSPSEDESQKQENESQVENQESKNKKSAEARIQELVAENKEKERLLNEANQRLASVPTNQPQGQQLSPQQKATADFLTNLGFETKDSVKREFDEREKRLRERISLDLRHESLERKYDGSQIPVKYDRSRVEEYMRSRGIYGDPEDAFKLMYEPSSMIGKLNKRKLSANKFPCPIKVHRPGSKQGRVSQEPILRNGLKPRKEELSTRGTDRKSWN